MHTVKLTGTTRCCRQKLLEKLYYHQAPFESVLKISLLPADHKGKRVYQVYINDIDIGFLPEGADVRGWLSVECVERVSEKGRRSYRCYLKVEPREDR